LTLGGTEGQFVEIARGLNRSRWSVHVGCLRAEGPNRARLEAAGVRPVSYGRRCSFRSPRFALGVVDLARSLRARRIALVHSFDFYSNRFGVLAARLARVPVVIASQRDLGNFRPPLQRWVQRATLRLAGYVVVNTEAVGERLRAGGIAPERIVLIPNGVDLSRFTSAVGSAAPRSGRVTVGTLAVLRPEKAIADLVRAAPLVQARCPAVRFVIWGDGPCRPALERLVRELGLEQVVELRGTTAQPEAALRDLDIFVLPSLSEACPNALLETMAMGLPVVATRVGGIPALVEDGRTGLLVPPGDPSALARAIAGLIEDPVRAAAMAARAREHVRNDFGLDRMLAGLQVLYDRALAAATTAV
jgi:glycosyltransferase involved in cell wall biosynthesis